MADSRVTSLSRLRTTALVAVVLTLLQAGLGFATLGGTHGLNDAHGGLGYLNFLVGIVAAVFAFQAKKSDARLAGLFGHAMSLPVLAFIQIGIIEASKGTGPLKWVHVVLGLGYLVSAVGLWTLSDKRAKAKA